MQQLVEALRYAHGRGVANRDVKVGSGQISRAVEI